MKYSSVVVKSSEVINKSIFNYYENLGKIEEIVLNKVSGQVKYVVLSFKGFLGFGDKLYAIPWDVISYDVAVKGFKIDMNIEGLQAVLFNKNAWPDFADSKFLSYFNNSFKDKIL